MPEFKTDFQSVDADIDRWMQLYGTPNKLSHGTPVIRGLNEATNFVVNLYFEHEAWDGLVAWYQEMTSWAESSELALLNDTLVQRKDVRRLRRLWGSIIAEQKMRFWEYHSFCRKGCVAGSIEARFYEGARSEARLLKLKTDLLNTLEHVRCLVSEVGDTDYAHQLSEDHSRIEREQRGKKLPRPVAQAIDDDCFWELVETAKQKSDSTAGQKEFLLATLETFKAGEITKFRKILIAKMDALYHWDVWALGYLTLGGCSDDMFEYFRAWLILQGRVVFELAIKDVEQLGPRIRRGQATPVEGLLSIPEIAYENRSGKPMRSLKTKPALVRGAKWEEADLPSRYPILSAYFA